METSSVPQVYTQPIQRTSTESEAELLGFSQSMSSIHCIIEEEDEDVAEEQETEHNYEDEHSEMDSDKDDEIDSDGELNDDDDDDENEHTSADNSSVPIVDPFDLDDDIEDETEIDSDDEDEVELIRSMTLQDQQGLNHKTKKSLQDQMRLTQQQDIVRELESGNDSSDMDEPDWFQMNDNDGANTFGASSMTFSNSEYSSSYLSVEPTVQPLKGSGCSSMDFDDKYRDMSPPRMQDNTSSPTIEPLKGSLRDWDTHEKYRDMSPPRRNDSDSSFIEPIVEPLKGGSSMVELNDKYRDMSPPRRSAGVSPPRRSAGVSPPRRSTGVSPPRRSRLDPSRSERGFRTYGGGGLSSRGGFGGGGERNGLSQSERGQRTFFGGDGPRGRLGRVGPSPPSSSQHDELNRSERGLRTIGADLSRSERGLRTVGADLSRSERGLRTAFGSGAMTSPSKKRFVTKTLGADLSRSERGLRTVGADLSRSERGLRTIDTSSSCDMNRSERGLRVFGGADLSRSERGLRSIGADMSQSERGFRTIGGGSGGGPRPWMAQLVIEALRKAANGSNKYPDPSSNSKSTQSTITNNHIELLQQRKNDKSHEKEAVNGTSSVPKKQIFKSVAERLFAARNDYYSSPDPSRRTKTGSEPSSSKLLPSQKQDSVAEENPYRTPEISEHGMIGGTYDQNDGVTAPPQITAAPSTVQEMVQDYRILAGRLKSLIPSVSIYHQAKQELRDARVQFLDNCDDLFSDIANGEADKLIRQWFTSLKQQHEEAEVEEEYSGLNDEPKESPPAHESLEPREILDYVVEWEDIVSTHISEDVGILKKLKAEKDHYDSKIRKLRRRMSWLSFSKKPPTNEGSDSENTGGWGQSKLDRNRNKQSSASQSYDAKEKEVAFLLQQVTYYGWKDLYPLVEATMQEECRRFKEEEGGPFGKFMPPAIAEVEGVLADAFGVNADSNSQESKPLLVLDDTSPHATVAWMSMLEHEPNPSNPILFDLQSPGSDDGRLQEKKGAVNVRKMQEEHQLDESTPFLIHKGRVLFGTLPLAEYTDQCWKDQQALVPSDPLEKYNMNKFLRQHVKMEQIWNDTLVFWLEWHCGENSVAKQTSSAYAQKKQELELNTQRIVTKVEQIALAEFPGPYFCGQRFTLADIHLFAYWEHILLLLTMMQMRDPQVETGGNDDSSTKGIRHDWAFHASKLPRLSTWYENVSSRPSALAIQQSIGTRRFSSMTQDGKHTSNEMKQENRERRLDHLTKHYKSLQQCAATLSK
ncbi:unnamed protein product [Cylindrotheca closterium]|uniref:GST C-terminal domain-containing protein n=1 Tax=Cylindrotheca closterium TaxID=2856 RepID=A0AAD2PYF2_9STRA|nr:unnamed protein product [Cylindrotheca closterium]